ncbi:hypothetical protein N5853_09385 [Bartonella sp. HY329]|uniref:hypothetical protein n=1 Tax=unclassified Bartonella TaxID=2645622 RepID=UPI0021C70E04|nr:MULTISPECIES: hypothetical protein [unclassified Bartonella]UXM94319.1 hypothetical protein N5853_09385 [Bartonella sp. HY329]UXN08642.1 hypothetical protein N5852_09395 [Bartonella sp. HY328]
MKVIVKQSGFYGGDWFDASEQAIDMQDGIAKQYLPPFGDTLQHPKNEKVTPQATKTQPKE